MRFCVRCQSDQPDEGFIQLRRGAGGRVRVWACGRCATHMKAARKCPVKPPVDISTQKDNYAKQPE